jgi:hypothetical protein
LKDLLCLTITDVGLQKSSIPTSSSGNQPLGAEADQIGGMFDQFLVT